jgi:hypothetical protein
LRLLNDKTAESKKHGAAHTQLMEKPFDLDFSQSLDAQEMTRSVRGLIKLRPTISYELKLNNKAVTSTITEDQACEFLTIIFCEMFSRTRVENVASMLESFRNMGVATMGSF